MKKQAPGLEQGSDPLGPFPEFEVVYQGFFEGVEETLSQPLVRRMLEVRDQPCGVVELEQSGVVILRGHQLFVAAAVGEAPADAGAADGRDFENRRSERIDERLALLRREVRPGTKQDNVSDHR